MAKGRKTGGRDFQPGNPGRPRGSKNKLPGSVKKSLIEHLRGLENERGEELTALFDRILSKGGREAIALLELALAYLHGRPVQRVHIQEPQKIVLQLSRECATCGRALEPPQDPKALEAAQEEEREVVIRGR